MKYNWNEYYPHNVETKKTTDRSPIYIQRRLFNTEAKEGEGKDITLYTSHLPCGGGKCVSKIWIIIKKIFIFPGGGNVPPKPPLNCQAPLPLWYVQILISYSARTSVTGNYQYSSANIKVTDSGRRAASFIKRKCFILSENKFVCKFFLKKWKSGLYFNMFG